MLANWSDGSRSLSYVVSEPQVVGWARPTASLSGATGLRPGRLRIGVLLSRSHRGVVGRRRIDGVAWVHQRYATTELQWLPSLSTAGRVLQVSVSTQYSAGRSGLRPQLTTGVGHQYLSNRRWDLEACNSLAVQRRLSETEAMALCMISQFSPWAFVYTSHSLVPRAHAVTFNIFQYEVSRDLPPATLHISSRQFTSGRLIQSARHPLTIYLFCDFAFAGC